MWNQIPLGRLECMLRSANSAPSLIKARADTEQMLKDRTVKKVKECDEEECEEDGIIPEELAELMGMARRKDRELLEDRGILIINSFISKETLARATRRMLVLHFDEQFEDDIQIVLNSPGGYCDAGWAFIDTMKFIKNQVVTVAVGEICSMATSIFISGEERVMSPNSTAMIHQYSGYAEGNYGDLVAGRKAEDMEAAKSIRHLIENSKYKTEADVKKYLLKEHDHWMSPKEMKKHGLCDSISKQKRKK